MGVTSAIVLFAVIWFMTFLIVLPLRLETQGDTGETVPGTHVSSPSSAFNLRRKVRNTTIWAIILWIIIAGVIFSGMITVRDMDWFDQLPPAR